MNKLELFCTKLRDYEGKPGNRNYRNNNPGNCRFSRVGYLLIYGEVKKDKDGFAIFKDYETGFLYLKNLITWKIHQHPNWTITQLMGQYAPAKDNNEPEKYASWLAKQTNVDVKTFTIKELLT